MRIQTKFLILIVIGGLMLLSGTASEAHTMLTKSEPAKDEVLKTSPKQIVLAFGHPTKLTQFKLVDLSKPKQEIPVSIDLKAPLATRFSMSVPMLAPGKYQIKWGTLSEDGHAMTGLLPFSVAP